LRPFIALLLASSVFGQTFSFSNAGGLGSGYRLPKVAPARLADSDRLRTLLRNGEIVLSLQDAIALALENNLDLELERYGMELADSDVLRSESGALPRGVPLSIREAPAGLGAPQPSPNGTLGGGDVPALESLIGPGVQVDLSILGSIPLATGTAVPLLDPQIVGNIGWNHTSDIQNSVFVPGLRSLNAEQLTADVAYQQGFSSGASLEVFFDNSRLDSGSPLQLYNPGVSSSVGIDVRQPLLRGFGPAVNRRYIRIAKNNRLVSNAVFQQQVIATVAGVVRLYWDLVSLREDVRVRREGVSSAEQFVQDTRNQVETGTAAEVDAARASAELARRRRDLSVAESLVSQQSTVLKDYLTRGQLDPDLAKAPLVTTDKLTPPDQDNLPAIDELVQTALRSRPETTQVRLQVENSELSLEGSKSALRPALDLVASAQNNGFAGNLLRSANVPGDALLTGGYQDSLRQVFGNDFPDYGVGLQLTVPIRNRAARSDVIRDQVTVRQQQVRMRQLEKQIRLEVTNALLAVEQAKATYEATRDERLAQEQTLSAEQERLDVGASTNFFVLQFQRDLAAAKSNEISSLAAYQKAKAALARVSGHILSDYHVELGQAVSGEVTSNSPPQLAR
jgi:outer membrane protein